MYKRIAAIIFVIMVVVNITITSNVQAELTLEIVNRVSKAVYDQLLPYTKSNKPYPKKTIDIIFAYGFEHQARSQAITLCVYNDTDGVNEKIKELQPFGWAVEIKPGAELFILEVTVVKHNDYYITLVKFRQKGTSKDYWADLSSIAIALDLINY